MEKEKKRAASNAPKLVALKGIEELNQLLTQHHQVFTDQLGLTDLTLIRIDTGESVPISSTPYCLSQARVETVKKR